ncbi:hypothetical protein N7492_010245 [Penicillium capsulatum]|uniref:Kynurenine formamidase n=1 Tax=Penicillium capsulatum TaxID=69766 RepID=A0A9W9HNE1_9EURO|nr:hypothetical protein N7492_010245 [Penicillium capsulatum]KAJ6112752.1 hypothetical protein N7512_008076 [Penicillium capsulatum]
MATKVSSRTVRYDQVHTLQTISVTQLDSHPDGYWVIYIHGGAWRDPTIAAESFSATESILRNTPGLLIAGFASISYRLSPHPNHPQSESGTLPEEYRSAKHPDHIRDVEAALALLQNTFGFGSRYILAGHSCGATLAFQAVMGTVGNHREQSFQDDTDEISSSVSPTAIVGVAGIYDLRRLCYKHREISAYREFIEGAFGSDETLWDAVSPAQIFASRGEEGGWKSGRLAVLAHSKDDELVDDGQLEAMRDALKGWEESDAFAPKAESAKHRHVRVLSINGAHDDAWSRGQELARAIQVAFEELGEMGLSTAPEK